MKRQRIGISAIPVVARARPVLRSSTKLNRMQVTASECMSYKELVKVVGVDCEASPSSWRKAIDHSAETVVFFQVDLRGVLPRMCKSVRICQEEEKLVPSVYIGESLLSATYVKTIIGKRFLTDEDDLMKLLEHAGILHEDGEFFEENAEDGDGGHGAEEGGENDPFEPEPKRARVAEKEQVVVESALSSGRRITRSSATALISQITAEPSLSASGGRQPVDLSPLLLLDKPNSMLPSSSRVRQVSLPVDDSLMAADFDDEDLPAADESGEEMTDVLPDAGSNRGGAEMEETSGLDPDLEDNERPTLPVPLSRNNPKMAVNIVPFTFLMTDVEAKKYGCVKLDAEGDLYVSAVKLGELRADARITKASKYAKALMKVIMDNKNIAIAHKHKQKGVGLAKVLGRQNWVAFWNHVKWYQRCMIRKHPDSKWTEALDVEKIQGKLRKSYSDRLRTFEGAAK
ncbi:uncharacterized protein LOC129585477 isoform X6 [Paramacrobiotus metropolitanus]|uniref:uncharacterized protein LOC129585477 isoform X6 n=1 Tax=Paramacrobiotus metropolitanus TaxID=2943436 RepID=UPI00244614BE|nr:uncharacterized protein LOC129585477 isoform X6 [Paramacrobiotus metropolitanus]